MVNTISLYFFRTVWNSNADLNTADLNTADLNNACPTVCPKCSKFNTQTLVSCRSSQLSWTHHYYCVMTIVEPTRFSRTARAPTGRGLGRHQSVRSHVWIPESYRQRTGCKMSSGTPLVNEQQVYRRRDLEGLPSEQQRRWSAAQPVHGPRYTGLHQQPHRVSTSTVRS